MNAYLIGIKFIELILLCLFIGRSFHGFFDENSRNSPENGNFLVNKTFIKGRRILKSFRILLQVL